MSINMLNETFGTSDCCKEPIFEPCDDGFGRCSGCYEMSENLEVEMTRVFEKTFDDCVFCQDCKHAEKTRDAYGTGDSPTMIECTGTPDECPGVEEIL